MKTFRIPVVAVLVSAVVAVCVAADAEKGTIDLKTFKFKVADEMMSLFGYDEAEGRLFYYTGGAAETTIKVPADGEYELVIKAACDPAQGERAKFKVTLDGEAVGKETLLTEDLAKDYPLTLQIKAGEHKLAIEFTNDVYKEGEYDRNFYVHAVSLKAK